MNNDDTFKTNNNNPITLELEARVVAWVLGEATPFEIAVLERVCAEQPELAVFKRRMEAVHGLVGEAARAPREVLRMSPERRTQLLATIGGNVPVTKPVVAAPTKTHLPARSWRSWALPLAACFTMMVLLAAVIIPTVGSVKYAKGPKRPDPSSTVLGPDMEVRQEVSAFELAQSEAPATTLVDSVPMVHLPQGNSDESGSVSRQVAGNRSVLESRFMMGLDAPAPATAPVRRGGSTAQGLADANTYTGSITVNGGTLAVGNNALNNEVTAGLYYDQASGERTLSAAKQKMDVSKSLAGSGAFASSSELESLGEVPLLGKVFKASGGKPANSSSALVSSEMYLRQRPADDKDNLQRSEPWNSPTQPRRKRSSVTITAGTPETVEGIEFTEADQAEIARRIAQRKAERLKKEIPASSLKLQGQLAGERAADYEDASAVIAEFTAEIEAIEAKAAQQVKIVVDESLRTEIPTATEAISTFSLHVSDASFRLAKAALARGEAPDASTIRPEEFYNAFDYGDPAPVAGEPVSCRIEQAAHPFLQQRNLVRVAMQVPAAGRGAGTPLRLTVLLDTSGSMEREDRAATVRAAFTSLASLLGPNDRVTLIGFARTPRLLAESVAGDQASRLIELAERTPAEGGTNMEEALKLAEKMALRQKLAGAQNRIVVLTDGAANLGNADPQQLAKRIEALRQQGIAFDACGVVADGLDDTVLEALTRKGDGRYTLINSPEDADAIFARQLAGAFRPAAKDVKVQVRFNPARVARYRLIGFEQHRLKTEDFRNDAVDAAELAAEEAAVALYQVEVLPEGEGELGDVSVRFLDTRSNERVERTWTLGYAAQPAAFARATSSMQLAGSAAFLAEKLRGGALAGQISLEEFAPVVEGLAGYYPQAVRVQEFITMFRQARRLTGE